MYICTYTLVFINVLTYLILLYLDSEGDLTYSLYSGVSKIKTKATEIFTENGGNVMS